jgi:hypothetical protein
VFPLASLCLAAGLAMAAPPPVTPTSERAVQLPGHRRGEEPRSIGVDEHLTTFAGNVLDLNDKPVSGVRVDLFVDGERTGSAVTTSDGHYELQARYDYRADATVILWYVPSDRSLLPKAVVLNESKASRENELISPCLPRANITPVHQFRVYLFDLPNRIKELSESNCLP